MENWEGKFAVVTGASSGVGAVITEKFAQKGINVIALARRSEVIEENINKKYSNLKGKIYAKKCDLSDFESIKETFKWIEDHFGVINILVNNAALAGIQNVLNEDEETTKSIDQKISTNLNGLVHCTRKAIGLMKKSDDPSVIININSLLGHNVPFMEYGLSIYAATKFGVRGFSEVARHELITDGNTKIRISSISPGLIRTEMTADLPLENIPVLEPNDIVDAIFYILSTPTSVNIQDILIRPNGANTY